MRVQFFEQGFETVEDFLAKHAPLRKGLISISLLELIDFLLFSHCSKDKEQKLLVADLSFKLGTGSHKLSVEILLW